MMIAGIYRAIGGGVFVGGNPDLGLAWMRTAAEVEPDFDYAEADVSADHPVRSGLKLAKVEVMGTEVTPMSNAPEFGLGEHYLDGKSIVTAEATMERFHVYQRVVDGTFSFVVDGNLFPDDAFGAITAPDEAPPADLVITEPVVPQAQVVKQKAWPAERIVFISAGTASLVASGALYGLSASSRGKFDKSNSVRRTWTNTVLDQHLRHRVGRDRSGGRCLLGFGVLFFVSTTPRPTWIPVLNMPAVRRAASAALALGVSLFSTSAMAGPCKALLHPGLTPGRPRVCRSVAALV